ncbi:MAG: hypothetical protein M3068_08240 [Gemmatimonadota bacterium]|nr:hypothetical protein [Gemmatimonadota bacterium]
MRARYFNAQDLNLGRDNHCRASASGLACYQSNSGPPPNSPDFPNATAALADIVNGAPPFATVAMDIGPSGRVNFYAFNNATDSIVVAADLDTDGKKAIPHACAACHGGTYDPTTHTMSNASFLPFDVFGFQFASAPGFLLADQQETFRKLNSLVKASQPNLTNPHNPIVTFIDGAYGGGVDVAGSTPSDSWVPAGWTQKPNVYEGFKRTCRTCHLAVDSSKDFTSYAQLKSLLVPVQVDICTSYVMPHAEVPYRKFWLNTNIYIPGYWQDPSVLGITCP